MYTLYALVMTASGMMEKIEATDLTQAQCTRRAMQLVELYDSARCRPSKPSDTTANFILPSGRVIKLEKIDGKWSIPNDLLPSDRRLVDELVSPVLRH